MKVYIGDIVKVRVDVIVDPIDTDFTPGGGAARWIAKFTGNEIFKEAQKKYGSNANVGDVYATGAGNLEAVGVKRIFHIPTVNWEKNERLTLPEINMTVVKAMELLRTEGLQSIAFPLLGTGTVGLDEARVTEEMSEGIVHMEKDYPELAGALVLLKHSVFESVKDSIRGSYELIELEQ